MILDDIEGVSTLCAMTGDLPVVGRVVSEVITVSCDGKARFLFASLDHCGSYAVAELVSPSVLR